MFCKNCGAEIPNEAKFCPKCGEAKEGEAPKKLAIEDNQVIYQIKPTFNIGYKLLSTISKAILWTFIIMLWLGLELWIELPMLTPITIVIVAIYVGVKLAFDKMQYEDLNYNFYVTKVEYVDGFLNKEQKELKYKYVREVTMTQSIFERMFNIGTIRIFTNASSGGYYNGRNNHNNMMGKNGINIHCVTNLQEQYQKVKELIDEGSSEEE